MGPGGAYCPHERDIAGRVTQVERDGVSGAAPGRKGPEANVAEWPGFLGRLIRVESKPQMEGTETWQN